MSLVEKSTQITNLHLLNDLFYVQLQSMYVLSFLVLLFTDIINKFKMAMCMYKIYTIYGIFIAFFKQN